MEKHAEILAPAGGEAQLRAAVLCGADAVYLGLRGFNARAGAENFDENTLPQTVGWCHSRGVKVYVTLNTLVTDRELPDWLRTLDAVAAAGVDGVLVQDLGLVRLMRRRYPTLPLLGSTQMSVHNLAGARLLEEMGLYQVVLARELSKEEIAAICAGTSLRCEVFVHGALCMSVSGQCYLSSVLGERSGNRGRCAQPCRLDFKSHGRSYALSLKDLTLTDRLRELEALGVASFKIEGRLKRPEYVAAAITACRQSLNGEVPDLETLRSVFSRSGFTDGYYTARRDLSMFGIRTKEDAAASAEVLGRLATLTRNEVGRLPADMVLTLLPGKSVTLAVTDGTHRVEVAGEVPQTALTRPTDEELARRALEKCGGTPFYLQNLTCHIAPGLMLPLSALNRLRAAALTALAEARSVVIPYPQAPAAAEEPSGRRRPAGAAELRCRLAAAAQASPAIRRGAGRLSLPLWELAEHPELIESCGGRLLAELPAFCPVEQEETVMRTLRRLKEYGLTAALCGNLGTLLMAREAGLAITGDYGLNIINSPAARQAAELGCAELTLSFECERTAARSLESPVPLGIIAYGHLPLMLLRNCPGKTAAGCGDCRGINHITDRRGEDFPLQCGQRQYTHLLNPRPLFLSDRLPEWDFCDFLTLRFTTESPAECDAVLKMYQTGAAPAGAFTRGLYYRSLK